MTKPTLYPAHELLKRDDWHLIIAPSDLRKEFSDVLAELAILQKDKESFKTMLKETEQHRSDIEKFLEDEDLSIDEFKGIWEENAKLRAELALKNPAVGEKECREAFEKWALKSISGINLVRSCKADAYYISDKADWLFRCWQAARASTKENYGNE